MPVARKHTRYVIVCNRKTSPQYVVQFFNELITTTPWFFVAKQWDVRTASKGLEGAMRRKPQDSWEIQEIHTVLGKAVG
jgi:hypothetical protein